MRNTDSYGNNRSAVLDAAGEPSSSSHVPTAGEFRRPLTDPLRARREGADDFANDPDTEAFLRGNQRRGPSRVRRGLMPGTRNGRIAVGVAALACMLAAAAGAAVTAKYFRSNEKFRIPASSAIEIEGNSHVTRSQMLSVFGEDVDRNIFKVPLEERRAQLEQMPWVEHATVMRLLPNHVRVHVVERTPVAFVRQGGNIGMVDASGVLLDIPPDAPGNPSYSFPVVTGLKSTDSPTVRAARMHLYGSFLKDMDSDGKNTSALLSEVDLSDTEDVKALIPDHNAEVLVHFGRDGFLQRYKKFEEHIGEWRGQYARLSSVDMRYERQVVLQMPPKDSTAVDSQLSHPEIKSSGTTMLMPTPVAKPVTSAVDNGKPSLLKNKAAMVNSKVDNGKPNPHVASATHVDGAKPGKGDTKKLTAKDIAMQKRVEAIKLWMAKREKLRKLQASPKVSLLDAVANPIEIRSTTTVPDKGGLITPHAVEQRIAPVSTNLEPQFAAGKYHATQVVQHP